MLELGVTCTNASPLGRFGRELVRLMQERTHTATQPQPKVAPSRQPTKGYRDKFKQHIETLSKAYIDRYLMCVDGCVKAAGMASIPTVSWQEKQLGQPVAPIRFEQLVMAETHPNRLEAWGEDTSVPSVRVKDTPLLPSNVSVVAGVGSPVCQAKF
jgi:hypothetical protein